MKKAWYFLTAIALTLSLSACQGQSADSSLPAESSSSEGSASLAAAEPSEPEETESSAEEAETRAEGPCWMHTASYHTITGELLRLAGGDAFDDWLESMAGERITIYAFIRDFQIPREDFERAIQQVTAGLPEDERQEYLEEYGYTDRQIDALYSGDQAAVSRAFCGPLAFYHETDGALYSIDWLAEHTAEDYLAADLPLIEVEEVVRAAETESIPSVLEMAQKARAALEDAWVKNGSAQETSPGGLDACTAHTPSYHSISAELMNYVGQEGAVAWAESIARSNPEQMTILAFIEEYDIPKEQFIALTQGTVTDDYLETLGMTREECYEEFGYTDQQIDALYSGDQAAVDRAFCGKLALFNEADGQLYSIDWLAEHTAEDYLAAGFPLEEVDAILENTSIPGYDYRADLVEVITPVLEEAKEMKAND